MCSSSHWQAYISFLTHHIAAITHEENVLVHRRDRCPLHARKNVVWMRRLHHRGTKATGKRRISRCLVERVVLLSCLRHVGTNFGHLIIQGLFDLLLIFHLDRHFWLNGIFIDFKGVLNAILCAQVLNITGHVTVWEAVALSHRALVAGIGKSCKGANICNLTERVRGRCNGGSYLILAKHDLRLWRQRGHWLLLSLIVCVTSLSIRAIAALCSCESALFGFLSWLWREFLSIEAEKSGGILIVWGISRITTLKRLSGGEDAVLGSVVVIHDLTPNLDTTVGVSDPALNQEQTPLQIRNGREDLHMRAREGLV